MSAQRSSDALDQLFAGRPDTLSVEEVAEVLNISKKNTYAWLRDGVIPGYKIGATWRVISNELKATMREGSNAPRHPQDMTEESD